VTFTGFPWNAIGYGVMPVPLMMQSAHVIGIMGVTALSVFAFSAPALFGTRQGAKPGIALAVLLFAAHLGYGAYVLYGIPKPAETPDDKARQRCRPRGNLRKTSETFRGSAQERRQETRHHRLAGNLHSLHPDG
jgi:short subunit dehydrogenase-like uncharacterized protein